jgi:hypothetical protein
MPATSGPWIFDRDTGIVGNEKLEKVVCFIRGNAGDEEACANGALIASAPDMRDVLQKLVEDCGEVAYWSEVLGSTIAPIVKLALAALIKGAPP